MMINLASRKSDLVGICASVLCTIHCLITPFIFMSRPLMDTMLSHTHSCSASAPLAWKLFDIIFLFIGLVAVYFSVKNNANPKIKMLLCLSWMLLAFGVMTAAYFGHWIMYSASFLLVATHFYNLKLGGTRTSKIHT